MENKIKSVECKFIIHKPGRYNKDSDEWSDDLHFVKEKVTYEDGHEEKRLKTIRNYKRPFWVTMEHYRKNKTKKEQELLSKVRGFESTETDLWKNVAGRLGGRYLGAKEKRQVCDSPYIYGCDVNSKVFLKRQYQQQYPDTFSKYEVASLDIETDIDTDEITVASIAKEWEIYTVIVKKFVEKELDVERRLKKIFSEQIPLENVKVSYEFVEDDLELFQKLIGKAHEWQPDFLGVWNIDFEMTIFQKLCERYNIHMEDVMSDPSIQPRDRYFRYKRGADSRVTASGVRMAFEPKDKWNVVYSSSSFYWIDPMTVYNYIRAGGKLVPTGYGLDSILGHELGEGYKKLKFPHLTEDGLGTAEWHKQMSKKHPLEYIVYNQWDVLSMLVLDAKIKDLNTTLPVLSGINPFDIFNSNPKKIVNDLMFVCLENGSVLGTNGMIKGEETETLGLSGWIVTLQNKLLNSSYGKHCVVEDEKIETNIRECVSDSDQTAGYPSNTSAANVSKETTTREVVDILGVPKDVFRIENINLTMGPVSHLQYCQQMLNFPTLSQIEEHIEQELAKVSLPVE